MKFFLQFIISSSFTKVHSKGLTPYFTLAFIFRVCTSLRGIILLGVEARIWATDLLYQFSKG